MEELDRRDFLRLVGLAGAGAALAACVPRQSELPTPPVEGPTELTTGGVNVGTALALETPIVEQPIQTVVIEQQQPEPDQPTTTVPVQEVRVDLNAGVETHSHEPSLLACTLQEAEAIAVEQIVAGYGNETLVGKVRQGERIATLINGKSTCSDGTHLHFGVSQNGIWVDPAGYLRPATIAFWLNPKEKFPFSGSQPWPIDERYISITQGFGMTNYARGCVYGKDSRGNCRPHNAIDMVNTRNPDVFAVTDGVLYNGKIPCRNGQVQYVMLDHGDSVFKTYYLHVNYLS